MKGRLSEKQGNANKNVTLGAEDEKSRTGQQKAVPLPVQQDLRIKINRNSENCVN